MTPVLSPQHRTRSLRTKVVSDLSFHFQASQCLQLHRSVLWCCCFYPSIRLQNACSLQILKSQKNLFIEHQTGIALDFINLKYFQSTMHRSLRSLKRNIFLRSKEPKCVLIHRKLVRFGKKAALLQAAGSVHLVSLGVLGRVCLHRCFPM